MCSDSLKRWGTKLWGLCVPATIPPRPPSNERLHSQSGRQDKRTLPFLSLQGKHLVLKTTPLVPGSFKVQHLEANLWIFIRNILTVQQGWGLLLGLCIYKHPPTHTHIHPYTHTNTPLSDQLKFWYRITYQNELVHTQLIHPSLSTNTSALQQGL